MTNLFQVATRGAIIYFIMSDLTLLNCMYNFSLEMFMNVFKTTVHSLGNSYLAPDQVRLLSGVRDSYKDI